MVDEITSCQWCSEEVFESQLETHWNKKKCPEKGIKKIMKSLKQSKNVNQKAFKNKTSITEDLIPRYDNGLGKLLFKLFKKPAIKIIWIWLSENATEKGKEKFRLKVDKYVKRGYEIRWSSVRFPK